MIAKAKRAIRNSFDKKGGALIMAQRFWEIDVWRGIAVIGMVVFHFLFDLNYFRVFPVDVFQGTWFWLGRAVALSFVFLAGTALTLSFRRTKLKMSERELRKKFAKRGAFVFACGLLITLLTFFTFPQGTIWFGVLHLMGASILLGYFFVQRPRAAFVTGIASISTGIALMFFTFEFPWLLWLGFYPKGLYTFDYFPLLPWFGVFLLGMVAGNWAYPKGKRSFRVPSLKKNRFVLGFAFLGRHSLAIYLLHQPLLLLGLKAAGVPIF